MFLAVGTAGATELQVQLGNQHIPDPSFGLVSDQPSLTTIALRVVRPLRPALNLEWVAAYEYGARSEQEGSYTVEYDEYAQAYQPTREVDTRLSMHGLEGGVRWSVPVRPWLRPYVTLAARAYIGHLRLSDSSTGWSKPDLDDPTGESTLYEMAPVHDFGAAVGVQGTAGVAVTFMRPRPPRPVALAMRMAEAGESLPPAVQGGEGAMPATAGSGEAAAPAAGAAEGVTPPAVKGGGGAMPSTAGSGEAAAPSAGAAEGATPPAAKGEAAAPSAGAAEGVTPPAVKAAAPPRAEAIPSPVLGATEHPRRWGWGMNLEVGYGLLTDLAFLNAGSLEIRGLRVQGGVLVMF
jgi:hypothetical protein